METYTKDLLENCSALLDESLQKNFGPLQEETLALLACIAQLIEDDFAQYYNDFMPGLKTILANTPNETRQQRDLKSNTKQCIGFLLEAVKDKQDEFRQDAIEIAQAFMSLLQPGVLKDDDPQVSSILSSLTQVSAILKNDFLPFMPNLMQKLLNDVVADVDFKLEDGEIAALQQPTATESGVTSITVQMKGVEGNKKLSLNTNALEAKINSV